MFSIELQLISLVSNPKGRNQALSIRIRGRQVFNVLLTSNEIRFSHKMLCFQLNYSLSPLSRTRREEIKRSLSESGVDKFLTFSGQPRMALNPHILTDNPYILALNPDILRLNLQNYHYCHISLCCVL